MILSVYIDESGTDGDRIVVAALVAREYGWIEWEREIRVHIENNGGIERLHTTRLHGQIRSNFPCNSEAEIQKTTNSVKSFVAVNILTHCELGVTATLSKSDYSEAYLRKRGLPPGIEPESEYYICFKYCVDEVLRWLWARHGPDIRRVVFFIEGGNEHTSDVVDGYQIFRARSQEHIKEIIGDTLGVIYNSDKKNRRLFAVDFFANSSLKLERNGVSARLDRKKLPVHNFKYRERRVGISKYALRKIRKATIDHWRDGLEFF